MIRADFHASAGRDPTEADTTYWLGLTQGDNDSVLVTSGQMTAMDYWHKRMLGWQAEGPDAAQYGPYSADPSRPVPN